MSRSRFNRQQGVALITVLLVVALASVIALAMTERLQSQVQRNIALNGLTDAKWVNVGAESFAAKVLKQDFKDSPNKSHLNQYWASGETTFPLDNGALYSGQIHDLNGCFNLNALLVNMEDANNRSVRPTASKQFIALLEALEFDTYEAEAMADSLQDWLDANSIADFSSGAEDSEYLGRQPGYLAANSLLVDFGELRAIHGFSVRAVERLRDIACVRPGDAQQLINLNTLQQPAVLVGLFQPNMTLDKAENFLSERPYAGWDSVDEALASSTLSGIEIADELKGQLTVVSDLFVLESETKLEDGLSLYMQSVLKKKDDKWAVISRRFGGKVERIPDPEAGKSF